MQGRYSAERLWAFRLRFSNAQMDSSPPELAGGGSFISIAFSSDACPTLDAGWLAVRVQKNASKQESRALILIQSEPKL
jgi:hypothetical protein